MAEIPEGRPHFWFVPKYATEFYEGWIDRAWLSQRFMPDYPEHAARIYSDDEFAAQVAAHFESLSQEDLDSISRGRTSATRTSLTCPHACRKR
jgi:hypothetical protein